MAREHTNSKTSDQPVYRDPVTGTTPAGPVQSEDAPDLVGRGRRTGNWGTAAKWFLLALLALAAVLGIGWFYW